MTASMNNQQCACCVKHLLHVLGRHRRGQENRNERTINLVLHRADVQLRQVIAVPDHGFARQLQLHWRGIPREATVNR